MERMKIDLHKVEKMFEMFKNKPVRIEIVGTIRLPAVYIQKFDWQLNTDEISFGNFEEFDDWYRIDLKELEGIYTDYDLMTHEDRIVFEIRYDDIFRTNIGVCFDCEMG